MYRSAWVLRRFANLGSTTPVAVYELVKETLGLSAAFLDTAEL